MNDILCHFYNFNNWMNHYLYILLYFLTFHQNPVKPPKRAVKSEIIAVIQSKNRKIPIIIMIYPPIFIIFTLCLRIQFIRPMKKDRSKNGMANPNV